MTFHENRVPFGQRLSTTSRLEFGREPGDNHGIVYGCIVLVSASPVAPSLTIFAVFLAMSKAKIPVCLHCESAPQEHHLRLCRRCAGKKRICLLYKKSRRWTWAWDAHVQRLVERASAGLPLFPSIKENEHEKIPQARSA